MDGKIRLGETGYHDEQDRRIKGAEPLEYEKARFARAFVFSSDRRESNPLLELGKLG